MNVEFARALISSESYDTEATTESLSEDDIEMLTSTLKEIIGMVDDIHNTVKQSCPNDLIKNQLFKKASANLSAIFVHIKEMNSDQ